MISKPYLKKILNTEINDKYLVKEHLGSGSFGDVFRGITLKTEKEVAIKIPTKNKEKDGEKPLLREYKAYKILSNYSKGVPDCRIEIFENKKILIMDLLGFSLEKVFNSNNKKIRMKSILLFATKMIEIIKYIHNLGFLHRDLKPDNFVFDLDAENIFLIDFGLSKKYVEDNSHIKIETNKRFVGTARYASINTHNGIEQSRRDDLESIMYILIYLFKGSLPWQSVKHHDKYEKYRLIGESKQNITTKELCKGLPNEFEIYLDYCKNLKFDEKPRYNYLKTLFKNVYEKKNYKSRNKL